MQKWEYLFVYALFADGEYRPNWGNDKEFPNWKKGPTIASYSNTMGQQGWELVGFDFDTKRDAYRLIFKRTQS